MFGKRRSNHDDVRWLEYIDGLYGYAVALTGDREESEVLVQSAYDYAMKALASVRNCSNVRVWMFSILRSFWRKQQLRNSVRPRFVVIDAKNDLDRPSHLEVRQVISAGMIGKGQLLDAIQQLPVELREIILLHELEALSYREIAGILCCEVKAVASNLAIARSRLRMLLSVRVEDAGSRSATEFHVVEAAAPETHRSTSCEMALLH